MASILKWVKVWFSIFLKPEATASMLKQEKPKLVDGILSFGLFNLLLGLLAFLLTAALATIGLAVGGNMGDYLIGLLIMFGLMVICFPLIMLILLLLFTLCLKIASIVFKGKAGFSEEYGLMGVIGSAALMLLLLFYIVIFVFMFFVGLIEGLIGIEPGLTSIILVYVVMGLLYIPFMPLFYMLMAFVLDVLADLEKVSIYKSGAILGLAFGLVFFLMMLVFSVIMFLFVGAMSAFRGGY